MQSAWISQADWLLFPISFDATDGFVISSEREVEGRPRYLWQSC